MSVSYLYLSQRPSLCTPQEIPHLQTARSYQQRGGKMFNLELEEIDFPIKWS